MQHKYYFGNCKWNIGSVDHKLAKQERAGEKRSPLFIVKAKELHCMNWKM